MVFSVGTAYLRLLLSSPSSFETIHYALGGVQMRHLKILDKMVDEEIATSVGNERIMALKGLFRGVLLIIISIPLFIFHWKKAQSLWHLNLNNQE